MFLCSLQCNETNSLNKNNSKLRARIRYIQSSVSVKQSSCIMQSQPRSVVSSSSWISFSQRAHTFIGSSSPVPELSLSLCSEIELIRSLMLSESEFSLISRSIFNCKPTVFGSIHRCKITKCQRKVSYVLTIIRNRFCKPKSSTDSTRDGAF